MLALCLNFLRKEGMNKVLITCSINNIGSQKIIENNMGILENIADGSRRYWINL
jgi:predicted acetyltransferase